MAKPPSHILELARKGAEHRYQELKAEIAALRKYFPELTRASRSCVHGHSARFRASCRHTDRRFPSFSRS